MRTAAGTQTLWHCHTCGAVGASLISPLDVPMMCTDDALSLTAVSACQAQTVIQLVLGVTHDSS